MYPIRPAQEKDLFRIAEILVFNYRLYFYPIFQDDEFYFQEMTVPALAERFGKQLDGIYVYDDGVVKGFVQTAGREIVKLFTEPVLHSQGIGAALLEYAVNSHGADHLWALEKNSAALRFYGEHGFRITPEKKYEEGTEEYLVLLKREVQQ
ncbi:MAG: GNAT family N-acetyltransferase [Solobacterium sp.]|nr:GNAT family N-acetyltransferase [Solobacterium sp.]